jgi:threonine dehydrogenase-like Zn-dependent dehydrogenase
MKANCWMGKKNVQVVNTPDPKILNKRDAIVRVTSTAICGSDLHLYNGFIPTMQPGDILGHEFMGEIVEVGPELKGRNVGDRVVVAFPIACGRCFFCLQEQHSLCENSNPNAWMAEKIYGHAPAGIFGYSHLTGGFAGGQAEYVRVPFADVGTVKIENGLSDEQVLFLSDILPTAYMAAENCGIERGDTVAIWGCGPVGQLAIRCCFHLGAERVIAIDRVPERLAMARSSGAETIDYEMEDVSDVLKELTGGRGPDSCLDAVGLEAHAPNPIHYYDRVKQAVKLETDRPYVFRQAALACRCGGTLSVPGVYGGFDDKIPLGAIMNKGLTVKTGQTHVQRYFQPLLEKIQQGALDASFIVTHRMALEEAPEAFAMFNEKENDCIKVVLTA